MKKVTKAQLWEINNGIYERVLRTKMSAAARKDLIQLTKLAFDILMTVK